MSACILFTSLPCVFFGFFVYFMRSAFFIASIYNSMSRQALFLPFFAGSCQIVAEDRGPADKIREEAATAKINQIASVP